MDKTALCSVAPGSLPKSGTLLCSASRWRRAHVQIEQGHTCRAMSSAARAAPPRLSRPLRASSTLAMRSRATDAANSKNAHWDQGGVRGPEGYNNRLVRYIKCTMASRCQGLCRWLGIAGDGASNARAHCPEALWLIHPQESTLPPAGNFSALAASWNSFRHLSNAAPPNSRRPALGGRTDSVTPGHCMRRRHAVMTWGFISGERAVEI